MIVENMLVLRKAGTGSRAERRHGQRGIILVLS